MKIIQKLLAKFGYIRVHKTTIELSTYQEKFFKNVILASDDPQVLDIFKYHLQAQQAITKFLRIGQVYIEQAKK
jgi:precorrin isomerase